MQTATVARTLAIFLLAALPLQPTAAVSVQAAEALSKGPSGYPLPRFVSLSASKVNVRMGPSTRHKVKWTFRKEGLPVEVVQEFGNWRQVRDAEGEEGWVHGSLLSGRRTVLVAPWSDGELVPLRARPSSTARAVAYLEPFVLADVDDCDGSWCEVSVEGWRGAVPQRFLWGVYPRERVD
jgi:SH3-like domain-containing protein